MKEYYEKIRDPSCKGAIFMAVCRGEPSENVYILWIFLQVNGLMKISRFFTIFT